jgi:septal ring factor EnvC (AmiA/AmiB activator)
MPTAVASQQQQQQQQKQQQQRIDSPPSSIAGAAAGFLVPRTPLINPTTGNPLQSYSGLSPQVHMCSESDNN